MNIGFQNWKWLFRRLSGRCYHFVLEPPSTVPFKDTVVLVHGILYNSLFMKWALGAYLARQGFRVYVYDYRSTRYRIAEHGQRLRKFLEEIHEPFYLVTHSMGGLLARVALAEPLGQVAGVLMLAPPNRGSRAASFWCAEVPGAGWIARPLPEMKCMQEGTALNLPMPAGRMPVGILGAVYDVQVASDLLQLPEPVPLTMEQAGHCSLLFSPDARVRMVNFLSGRRWQD